MMIANEKIGRWAKTAARRGPKPVKKALKCVNYSTSKFLKIFDFKGGGPTSIICGDFSVALRGGLRFVFNFELGQ